MKKLIQLNGIIASHRAGLFVNFRFLKARALE